MRSVLLVAVASLLLVACGGESESDLTTSADSTPVPTATPFAAPPEPTVVTGGNAAGPGDIQSEDTESYTVVSGDVLGLIAERFDVDAEAIRQLNDLDGDDIFVGQALLIPLGGAQSGDAAEPDSSPPPSDGGPALPSPGSADTYTVEDGDTAYGIALAFDTTVEALEAANGVESGGLDDLQLEQELQIPPPGER